MSNGELRFYDTPAQADTTLTLLSGPKRQGPQERRRTSVDSQFPIRGRGEASRVVPENWWRSFGCEDPPSRRGPESLPRPEDWPERSQRAAYYDMIGPLRVPWDLFLTLTHRYEVPLHVASRNLFRLLRETADCKPGWSRSERTTRLPRFVASLERHSQRDGFHVHALLADVADVDECMLAEWWEERYGLAKIEPYDPLRAGLAYVLKDADLAEATRDRAQIVVATELFDS